MNTDQTLPHGIEEPGSALSPLIWAIIVILSVPPIIIAETGLRIPPGPLGNAWNSWMRIIFLATLWILSLFWPKLKPIGGYTLALLAFFVAKTFLEPFVFDRGFHKLTPTVIPAFAGMAIFISPLQHRASVGAGGH